MKETYISFGAPIISELEIQAVVKTLRTGWLGKGNVTAQFQNEFATYKGIDFALGVNSCTAALHIALLSLDIGPGDEVITTSNTFCATVNTIVHTGATPVLVDIDPSTLNIDVDKIEEAITKNTKCIIPVHFAGRMCDMNKIIDVARAYNVHVIEDCAHAIETERDGLKAGTVGDIGCFSFYSTKNITCGEGGMLITDRLDIIERAQKLSLHGLSRDAWNRFNEKGNIEYDVEFSGFKYNMFDLTASLGLSQFRNVDTMWGRRREIWNIYTQSFEELDIELPAPILPNERHAAHLYTLLPGEHRSDFDRLNFSGFCNERGIGTGIHYKSIASYPGYQKMWGWSDEDYPNSKYYGDNCISIPLTPHLTDGEVERVVDCVKAYFS